MNQHKFKAGDRVLITRASTQEERNNELWRNCWTGKMDEYIGKIVTIKEIIENKPNEVRIEEHCYGWPTFVMRKVDSQLLFDFMYKD